MSSYIVFKMTRQDALELGLLTCKCRHRPNNHFHWGKKSCAHCGCQAYDEVPVRGVIVKPKRKKRK